MKHSVQVDVGGRPLIFECGQVARQASGAVVVRSGDTMVLVAATSEAKEREGLDFVPLLMEYQEMSYAAGRIPGNFFRREIGRPSDKETLTARLMDRPIRPLFPKGFIWDTQVVATVLSVEPGSEPDVLALTGASAALHISNLPFHGPIAAVRIGRVDGKFVVNPGAKEIEAGDMNLVVAASRDAVVMVEGGAEFASEEDLLEAIDLAHRSIVPIIDAQEELRRLAGVPKMPAPEVKDDPAFAAAVRREAEDGMRAVMAVKEKMARRDEKSALKKRVRAALAEQFPGKGAEIEGLLEHIEKEVVRKRMVTERIRIDGRKFEEIRPITAEVGILPRAHGSALFTRGETQALVVVTLGSSSDEQKVEGFGGDTFKSFMLHYNFPPYCVGEVKKLRGPGRREIGHGALAERAVRPALPKDGSFPYTIRVVSEIMESNGSSSMASVCGASLSLMDAGVPLADAVGGIAMGLVKEGDEFVILSDIIGDEDHLGDMDFKVTGNERGVTALQMDIKVKGISREIMAKALKQAREGRLHILSKMKEGITAPRPDLSPYAPRAITIQIPTDKIRDVIGPGGKMIRSITAETCAKIDIDDTGRVLIMSPDMAACQKAIERIRSITATPEIGQVYLSRIVRVTDFGAFAEILPNTDGLIHISQLDIERVKKTTDVVNVGDEVLVKVIEIDKDGRIRLSRKAVLEDAARK